MRDFARDGGERPPDPAGAPVVEVAHLAKRFEKATALEDLSFSIGENEFCSLVGPSGCGKSTALRLIAGLVAPSGGSARVRGAAVRGPIRDVGMVFQAPVLLPWRRTL